MNKLTDEQKTKIRETIADKLGWDDLEEIKDSSNLQYDLGADSLDLIELLLEFEKEFNVLIPDELAEKVSTISDVYECIEEAIQFKNR
jgi:acyl carrier protein